MTFDTTAGISPAATDTAFSKMIKVKACAEMLGASESTVHRMLTAKKLRGKTPTASRSRWPAPSR